MSGSPSIPAPSPKRPRFRFGLRMMFVVVTAVCIWLGWNMHVIRQRQELLEWVRGDLSGEAWTLAKSVSYHKDLVGRVDFVVPTIPFWRRWLGDDTIERIFIPESNATDANLSRLAIWFPEAEIVQTSPAKDLFDEQKATRDP